MVSGRGYTMGRALEILRVEFADLNPSALRFLEKQGLLRPQRTQGGHRLYSSEDLARIRLIKRLQAQRYYPLEVIRHMLAKLERATDLDEEIGFLESLYSPVTYDPEFVPLSREQLSSRTGLTLLDISRLEELGLLFPHTSGNSINGNGRRYYDEDDLKVAELVAHELRLGARLDDFASYAAAMRALVEEEFKVFRRLAGDQPPAPERVRQLKAESDLVHNILRAKLTRQLMRNR